MNFLVFLVALWDGIYTLLNWWLKNGAIHRRKMSGRVFERGLI